MSIALLAPLYLLGLLGLSVPIILHLLHRRPQRIHAFPTLRFLLKKKMAADRQRDLKRLLILLMRCLALLALALAFAYPFLKDQSENVALGRVILIDRSASMQISGRMDAARDVVLKEINGSIADGAIVAVVSFAEHPELTNSLDTKPSREAIHAVEAGHGATDIPGALALAGNLLESRPFQQREVIVVSDFAGRFWTSGSLNGVLPQGVTLRCLEIEANPPEVNLAVTSLESPRAIYNGDEVQRVAAQVKNFSTTPREVVVTLNWVLVRDSTTQTGATDANEKFSEKKQSKQSVVVPALAETRVEFELVPERPETILGNVKVTDVSGNSDEFPMDDARYFTIPGNEPFVLARIQAKTGANAEQDIFLKTAFAPYFERENRRFQWLDQTGTQEPLQLAENRVEMLLLDQGTNLTSQQQAEVLAFVENGGRLLLFLGEPGKLQAWEQNLLGEEIDLGRLRTATNALASTGRAGSAPGFNRVQLGHSFLEPFSRPGSGNLFDVKLTQWREIRLENSESAEAVSWSPLLSLDDQNPLVLLGNRGQGHIMLWAFPPDRQWTDWPVRTTFLPFLYQYSEWGGERAVGNRFHHTVGGVIDAETPARVPGVVRLPNGEVHVVNMDAAESDLEKSGAVQLLPKLAMRQDPEALDDSSRTKAAGLHQFELDEENPAHNWVFLLLIAMLIFSTVELLLANRTAT